MILFIITSRRFTCFRLSVNAVPASWRIYLSPSELALITEKREMSHSESNYNRAMKTGKRLNEELNFDVRQKIIHSRSKSSSSGSTVMILDVSKA